MTKVAYAAARFIQSARLMLRNKDRGSLDQLESVLLCEDAALQ
jgi:hypothetical protein